MYYLKISTLTILCTLVQNTFWSQEQTAASREFWWCIVAH
jgi:hypothetical protein